MAQAQSTTGRPYHHGHLRATLLGAAEEMLREHGVEQVSLRALARQAGVSHGAPRHHFRDRQALLDALMVGGYDRLADDLNDAIQRAGDDFEAQFRAAGSAFVRFAVNDAALLDLMLANRNANHHAHKAPERPFLIVGELIQRGQATGELKAGDLEVLRLLILATFQGIAALVTSRRVSVDHVEELVFAATALFVSPDRRGVSRA